MCAAAWMVWNKDAGCEDDVMDSYANMELITQLTNILPYIDRGESMYADIINSQNALATAEHDLNELKNKKLRLYCR